MGKKLPNTPKSQIRSALRRLYLRSRERAKRLKDDGYCCQKCGVKQSRAKGKEVYVEVHHIEPIEWEPIIRYVAENLLVSPDKLITLCKECHKKEG